VNSIYRCRAKVAFKPAKSKNVIVFPERQIDSVSVKLKQNVTTFNTNTSGGLDDLLYSTKDNECTVTLNDPYLDGAAWPVLGNMAQVMSGFNAYQNAGTLLPKCEKGQDPDSTPCYPFYDTIDDPDLVNLAENRGWIIISLYYEIEGIGITSEFQTYFKATKVTIDHGSKYPQVTMRGQYAFSTDFNQTIPVFFEKGKPVLKQLNDKIFSKSGYKIESVCGEDEDEVSEKSYKSTALSPGQLLQKYSGEKEFMDAYISAKAENAKVIQICNKTDYSCRASRVFYLGKGLYKQYSINAEYAINEFDITTSRPKTSDPENPEPLPGLAQVGEGEFKFSKNNNNAVTETIEKINAASSNAFTKFEGQFDEIGDYSTGNQAKVVFKGEAKGKKFTITKLEKNAAFGNAKEGMSYLGGKVTTVSKEEGRVVVKSTLTINLSAQNKEQRYYIHQEYTSLSGIKVKEGDDIEIGAKVGEVQTGDKQTKTRYFIRPPQAESSVISITPATVRLTMSVTEPLKDKEQEDKAPDSSSGDNEGKTLVGWVGYSGNVDPPGKDGAHLHAEISTLTGVGFKNDISPKVTAADLDPYITIGGKKPSQWETGSPYGPRNGKLHEGVDIVGAGIIGQPIDITNPNIKVNDVGSKGGYGSYVVLDIGGGKGLLLAHLLPSPPQGADKADLIPAVANKVTSSPVSSGGAAPLQDKFCFQLKTEFQGVPRALEIEPGKTVLSFVSDYDSWIEGGKDDTQVDPGVWVPDEYRNWFVNETEWKWEKGNLKVTVNALRRPDTTQNQTWEGLVPTFSEYLQDYEYADYYDYIRSPSDLCYKRKDGKLSCNECGKPSSARREPGQIGANDVKSEFPPGKFKYTCSKYNPTNIQKVIDAASQLGINSAAGTAGILGNGLKESSVNGVYLNPQALGAAGELGIFQWNGPRKAALEQYAAKIGGDPKSINTQMSWFVYEVKNNKFGGAISGEEMIRQLNATNSANEATRIFEAAYERAGTPVLDDRQQFAREVLECLKPS